MRFISRGFRRACLILWISPVVLAGLVVAHYRHPYEPRALAAGVLLWIAIATAWYLRMGRSGSFAPAFLAQVSALGAAVMVRRQLMLTLPDWRYEYDVWASLLVSLALAVLERGARNVRVPSMITLGVMPLLAIAWIVLHGLGPDIALLVVGLHSLIFAYLGRGGKDAPCNAVATLGFVAFAVLAFWTKLEFAHRPGLRHSGRRRDPRASPPLPLPRIHRTDRRSLRSGLPETDRHGARVAHDDRRRHGARGRRRSGRRRHLFQSPQGSAGGAFQAMGIRLPDLGMKRPPSLRNPHSRGAKMGLNRQNRTK